MHVVRTEADQERQISKLTADYDVLEFKSVMTLMVVHLDLEKSHDPPQATIPQANGGVDALDRQTYPP